jgi:hypothetical protein
MKKINSILVGFTLVAFIFSCAGPTQQERGTNTGALIGAIGGAILESAQPSAGFRATRSALIWIGRNRN